MSLNGYNLFVMDLGYFWVQNYLVHLSGILWPGRIDRPCVASTLAFIEGSVASLIAVIDTSQCTSDHAVRLSYMANQAWLSMRMNYTFAIGS